MTYAPNPALDPIAEQFGRAARELVQKGSNVPNDPHAYVNYAYGDEGVESWYGYDQAGLGKLKTLIIEEKVRSQWEIQLLWAHHIRLAGISLLVILTTNSSSRRAKN